MTSPNLPKIARERKNQIGLTNENIAKLSGFGDNIVSRFFAGEKVKSSTVERLMQLLGLDISGNEIISIDKLREQRAIEKALYIVSLVQDTSSLEEQGLDNEQINLLLEQAKDSFLHEYKQELWAI